LADRLTTSVLCKKRPRTVLTAALPPIQLSNRKTGLNAQLAVERPFRPTALVILAEQAPVFGFGLQPLFPTDKLEPVGPEFDMPNLVGQNPVQDRNALRIAGLPEFLDQRRRHIQSVRFLADL